MSEQLFVNLSVDRILQWVEEFGNEVIQNELELGMLLPLYRFYNGRVSPAEATSDCRSA